MSLIIDTELACFKSLTQCYTTVAKSSSLDINPAYQLAERAEVCVFLNII
jgi:hypothetical protein